MGGYGPEPRVSPQSSRGRVHCHPLARGAVGQHVVRVAGLFGVIWFFVWFMVFLLFLLLFLMFILLLVV